MSASGSSSNPEVRVLTAVARVRVRYAETDAMGWVYYACYYHYFEVARSEMIRGLWKSYRRIEDEDGLRLPVIESGCKYVSGARYEDELDIETELHLQGARLRFQYTVRQALTSELVSTGFTVHCFASHDGRPKRAPSAFLMLFAE
ncbi:MAG: acyl-CoA thioesterase [bacterium]|nr:acyl-CoA thioesterase [bacterium]